MMVPKTVGLAGRLLAAFAAGPDALSLVARLGAPKYVDRQAAAAELTKLGPAAFPALRAAREDEDTDPEVKIRAALLLESIERSTLAEPLPLHFEPGRYTTAEIARRLTDAQGVDIGVAEASAKQTIEFREPTDIGVWPLVDTLGLTLQNDGEADYGRSIFRRPPMLRLAPGPIVRARTSDSGPFRATVRTPYFAENSAPDFRNRAAVRGQDQMTGPDLVVPIDLTAEPRLSLRLATTGPIQITEAIDGQGRSLVDGAKGELDPVVIGVDRALSTLPLRVRLHPRAGAVTSLKRLRGTIPVEIEAKALDPIVMPIPTGADDERRPIACGSSTIQVNGLATSPFATRGSYIVDVTIRRDEWIGLGQRGGRRMASQLYQLVNSDDQFWDCIEIVDAQGKPFRRATRQQPSIDSDGIRLQLALPAREDADPPTEVRFHTTIRTTRDVPFDFKDVAIR